MNKLISVSMLTALLTAGPALAADGAALFQSKGCSACHHATEDRSAQGLGPSLQQVAEAYGGDSEAVEAFLKGEGEPKVYPDKYPIMKTQLGITKALPEEELQALASYLAGGN
jgi:cytochrome c